MRGPTNERWLCVLVLCYVWNKGLHLDQDLAGLCWVLTRWNEALAGWGFVMDVAHVFSPHHSQLCGFVFVSVCACVRLCVCVYVCLVVWINPYQLKLIISTSG